MERAVAFGPDDALIGVYNPAAAKTDVCCLLINAGVIHRVGPHRLNVKIARSLAQASIASLRFDLSGRGDSRAPASTLSYSEQAVQDLRTAMDFVERNDGPKRFIVFGICSGAVNAFQLAVADPRVAGILMLDGYWYRTRWTEPVRLWKRFRALSARSIFMALRRRLSRSAPANAEPPRVDIFATNDTLNPPIPEFAAQMNRLTDRGLDAFFLYSGTVPELVSYAGQLRDTFRGEPFIPRVRCELHDDIDHTAVSLHAQRKIVTLVRDWATRIAGARRAAAA